MIFVCNTMLTHFEFLFVAMVMADVTVLTDMWKEEEKRIKELLEKLGQQMKDHGVGGSKVKVERLNCNTLCNCWQKLWHSGQ